MYQEWDLALKATAAIAAIIGGSIGLWKYFDTSKKEFRKPYWEKQIELYLEATATAATLATIKAGEKREEALNKFWQLYFGPLAMVEDESVEGAMVRFGEGLIDYEEDKCSIETLRMKSLALAHACRESLGKSWKIDLAKLEGKYNEKVLPKGTVNKRN